MRFSAVALLLAVLMTACTSSQRNTQGGAIPPWVMRLPEAKGKLYAMGISGPTYYLEDGKTNAAENARKELAKSLSTHVQELSLMMQREEEKREGEVSLLTVSSWATDIVVTNSQILEVWVDEKALMPESLPRTIYALAVIDLSTVQGAVQKLRETVPQKK
ncbi:MAG TPA: hypothetical protein DCP63_13160 [Bacteroidetes bacterium]|nr:hypothetical protein [Bacteroidota bacterium]